MTSLPGFTLAAAVEAKQDAQLAVCGQTYEYVSKQAGKFLVAAIAREGSQEGKQVYFMLFAKPSAFPVPPEPGDQILLDEQRWYTVMDPKIEEGWQVLTLHYRGKAY